MRCLALSFFNSEESASERFKFLKQTMGEKIYEELGKYIACLELNENDGVAEMPNKAGHFNFHPADQIDLELKIIKTEKL